ncbi:hypothetical protein GDO81_017055 [Engystomops pustulosus]|uniref:Methyltransferase type 11 domain-containing protein n=1 Tax=Engystomops pustulosus TaxID=76066 RepID=A0AAV7AB66_ENGPU|nr:hypothetical protein GDO81_017055 [Engystomops pustulosus]
MKPVRWPFKSQSPAVRALGPRTRGLVQTGVGAWRGEGLTDFHMATRLFEEKEHASSYQKYRFSPAQEIQDMIFSYLHEKLNKPYELAVDVGCGTGLSTKILSPHFKKVLGIDISKAQIEEAKNAVKFPNTIFRVSPAEEVPVDDASVDLLTACAAVHWFDIEKLLTEVKDFLTNYQNEKMHHVQTGYKEIFDCIPYTDKLRFLDIMEVSSSETEVELWCKHVVLLASKPKY